MAKTKVLIFIDWYMPGFKAGGPITSVRNLVANLHADFDFSIITRDRDYLSNEAYDVERNKWVDLGDCRVYYMSPEEVNKQTIQRLIDETEHDVVYINGIYSPNFSILPAKLVKSHSKKVVIAVRGMLAPGALGIKSAKKKAFLQYTKLTGLYRNVIFHATNEAEKEQILDRFKDANVQVAPNLPPMFDESRVNTVTKSSGEIRLIYLGRIAPEKNTLFALQSLTSLNGKVTLDMYGSVYGDAYWAECQKVIAQLPEDVTATHKGAVTPDQVSELLSKYHYMYLPSLGENFGHVVLESLLVSTPVVISDRTPWTAVDEAKAGLVVDIDDLESATQKMQTLIDQGMEEYESSRSAAGAFAQNYVQNNGGLELNKQLFRIN